MASAGEAANCNQMNTPRLTLLYCAAIKAKGPFLSKCLVVVEDLQDLHSNTVILCFR